jgi:hypothetical protein
VLLTRPRRRLCQWLWLLLPYPLLLAISAPEESQQTNKPDRIIQSGQETDTTSNNRVQILDAIETKPRNLRDWTSLTLAAPVSPPQQHSESSTVFPTPEPLLPSDRIFIEAPTAKHTGIRGSNNYLFTCKYWPKKFPSGPITTIRLNN